MIVTLVAVIHERRPRAFHTMVYVEEMDTAYVFGGLIWKSQRLKKLNPLVLQHFDGSRKARWSTMSTGVAPCS